MPDVKITVHGLTEALAALQQTETDLIPAAAKPAAEATVEAVKPYPQPSRARQPFRSNQSRRFFFAALRSGQITVPYRRTGALASGWAWQPAPDGAVVSNPHPHADKVVTKNTRYRYHKGTWKDEEQLAEDAAPKAVAAAEQGIIRLVAKV